MEYDDKVKIGDYTVAIEVPDDDYMIEDSEGSMAFQPPECMLDQPFKPKPMDIWAFGVSLYIYLTLKLPFDGEDD